MSQDITNKNICNILDKEINNAERKWVDAPNNSQKIQIANNLMKTFHLKNKRIENKNKISHLLFYMS